MRDSFSRLYLQVLRIGTGLILVIVPFYTTLSIWAASRLHHLDFLKIWEEIILVAIMAVAIGFMLVHRQLLYKILRDKLVWLMIAYSLLLLGIGAYDLASGRVADRAVIYGWLVDLRMVAIFMATLFVYAISQEKKLPGLPWGKIVLIPAALVVIFGFLQLTVLPKDVLSHFGYSAHTTLPYETVDNRPDLVRIQSTQRGANPLGAYLVLVITMILSWLMLTKNRWRKAGWAVFGLMCLAVLYGTYSRSAEVGLLISLVAYLTLKNKAFLSRYWKVLVSCLVVIVAVVGIAAYRHNYLAQNVLFHSSNKSTSSVSSNAQRSDAEKRAVKDIYHHPLGGGIGSAGPASRRNDKGAVKIAENFYLQIGQEAGIIGMILFVVINILIGIRLWISRHQELSAILLASLLGLSFINLLSHAWADDTLSYVWWGLAGIALAPGILGLKAKNVKKS